MQQMRAALRHGVPSDGPPMFKIDHLYHAPTGDNNNLYQAPDGYDSGSRVGGFTSQPTGVPLNPRHRKFMGMEQRPGTIRL